MAYSLVVVTKDDILLQLISASTDDDEVLNTVMMLINQCYNIKLNIDTCTFNEDDFIYFIEGFKIDITYCDDYTVLYE